MPSDAARFQRPSPGVSVPAMPPSNVHGRDIFSTLGAPSFHRAKLLPGRDNPTPAGEQSVAAQGAQARDDLSNKFTDGFGVVHAPSITHSEARHHA
ncbi:hypothetical protein [Sphingobium sp. SYK-6]|uniref:hypothetical protein n=1 Tax=Sphingobium sp. (strain NBRC 103272 / SYK-6) TaxID=627192 RepID=UPI001E4061F0|nr:hypothetical protein [Sphingobium sp. SYK-6]